MEGIQDEDLLEMYSMKNPSQSQSEENITPFDRLKREFEMYEKELQGIVKDYQSNLNYDILTSTRQRIKILEELDEAREDSTILNELRNRVDDVKKKVWVAKSLMSQQKTEMSQSLSRGSVSKPLNRFEQSLSKMTKKSWTETFHHYQEMLGGVVGYFLVFMLSNESFREKIWRVWSDIWCYFQGMISGWKEELRRKDQQYHGDARSRGWIMRFVMWSWSWIPWSMDSAKRVIVWGNDYLGFINSGPEPFRGKVMHIVHDAQRTLHTKQEQMKKGFHDSLNVGKEVAQHPMDFLPVSANMKNKLRSVVGGGGSEVELKRRNIASTEVKGAGAEVSKR